MLYQKPTVIDRPPQLGIASDMHIQSCLHLLCFHPPVARIYLYIATCLLLKMGTSPNETGGDRVRGRRLLPAGQESLGLPMRKHAHLPTENFGNI